MALGSASGAGRGFAAADARAAAGDFSSIGLTTAVCFTVAGGAAFIGLDDAVLAAPATGFAALTSGVFAAALTFSAAVLAAFAATARLGAFVLATAVLALAFAAVFVAAARVRARALVEARRVAAAAVLAVLSFAVELAFVVVAFEVIVLLVLADDLALVFWLEALAARDGLLAEAERLVDFFDVELLAAADLVAPLLAARLAIDLERPAEPLARAAAVEAGADDFFSAFLLEGIRGLLLCCPAVETGLSLPDESLMPSAMKPRHREGG